MEQLPKNENIQFPIERRANSQEHPSVLLINRLKNPVIQEQLISLYENYYRANGNSDDSLREKISIKLLHRINQIEKDTPIDVDIECRGERNGADLLNSSVFRENMKPLIDNFFASSPNKNIQVQAIIESHEKGHIVRLFDDEYFSDYFRKGFEVDMMKYDMKQIRKAYEKSSISYMFDEDTDLINYLKEYLFSGSEIAERMSQIKAYFGMSGSEEFKIEHLNYAKENYVLDTGLDNQMTEFFSSITPRVEKEFIKIINSSGI